MAYKQKKKKELKRIINGLEEEQCLKPCILCGSKRTKYKSKPNMLKCTWKGCGKFQHVWKGTIFERTHLKKWKILRLIELWMQKASRNIIAYILGINKKAIWRVMKAVSNQLVPSYYENVEKIGGKGEIVEIDESKFGKRKYNRGHCVDGVWVLGAVEETNKKRIILMIVDDRKKETLTEKLKDSIAEDSVLYTDGWKGYVDLSSHFEDHKTVNHSKNFKDPETGVHTNTIEGSWCGIKMHVPFRGRTKKEVNLYLVRYMILKNEEGHPLDRVINYLF